MSDSSRVIPGYVPTTLLDPAEARRYRADMPLAEKMPHKFPPCPPLGCTMDEYFKGQDAGGKLPPDPKFDRTDPFGCYAGYDVVTPQTHPVEPLYLPEPERRFHGLSDPPEYTVENPRPVDIVFIGGGLAGIEAAIMFQWRLKNAKFRIYEKNPEVGGTWWDNRYPGLRCDVPSFAYTFRFENNDWSEGYAQGPEIQKYFARVAKKYNVLNVMTVNAEVRVLEWQEGKKRWKVGVEITQRDGTGKEIGREMKWDEADFVINGMGFLNRPKDPDIPGFKSFRGIVAHTARWPRDLEIKPTHRVGIIGTGSSGLQVAGAIAPKVNQGHLEIFQRTPSYILPEQAPLAFTPEQKKQLLDRKFFWRYTMDGFSGAERFFSVYFPGSKNQVGVLERARKFMRESIKDPALLKKMLPDYPIGCRRLTFTRPFLEAIHMKHVNVNVDPIVRIDETGVVTKAKAPGSPEVHTPIDILVCATGFDTSFTTKRMKITGRNGKDLWDAFTPWPKAYRSVTVHGFPNYSFTMGPAAPLAHNSIYNSVENQINYALQMIVRWQCDPTILSYEVKHEAVEEFNREAQEFLKNTVWVEQCGGWYNDRNKGYLLQWPGSGMHHMLSLKTPEYDDYEIERKTDARL
ncbi:hypothetical protein DFJ74DRAFT_766358 [Hyaloraphidium curvatum]|nr:hypothetical protein DFJ74DRAFT_766358 [Hyaloraphidium curvatum]